MATTVGLNRYDGNFYHLSSSEIEKDFSGRPSSEGAEEERMIFVDYNDSRFNQLFMIWHGICRFTGC